MKFISKMYNAKIEVTMNGFALMSILIIMLYGLVYLALNFIDSIQQLTAYIK